MTSQMKYMHSFLSPLFALGIWILNQTQRYIIMMYKMEHSDDLLGHWRSLNIPQIFD